RTARPANQRPPPPRSAPGISPTPAPSPPPTLPVQPFVQQHPAEDLPLDRLAHVAHFSPYHFHRVFKALTGEGVYEYVRRLRLESAAVALKTTRRGVTQIALGAGYNAHEAFTRAFRQRFGVSPSQYRARRPPHPLKEAPTMTAPQATSPARVEALPPRRVAFVRNVGPYNTVGPAFERLMGWAGRRGLLGPGSAVLGVCHDDPDVTPPEKV